MSKFCTNPHHLVNLNTGYSFSIPCRSCTNCINFKKKDLIWRFITNNLNEIPSVEMWTLGTNWNIEEYLYYGDKENIHKISQSLTKFQKRLKSCLKYSYSKYQWVPIYRVLEYGKSGFLHWHIITHHFNHRISVKYKGNHFTGIQKLIRFIWSEVTNIENPNVNYSYRRNYDPIIAFKYVTKYLSKDTGYVKSYMHKPLWKTKKKQSDPKVPPREEHNWVFHSNQELCDCINSTRKSQNH